MNWDQQMLLNALGTVYVLQGVEAAVMTLCGVLGTVALWQIAAKIGARDVGAASRERD